MQLEKAVWFKSIYFDTWIIKNKTGVDWLQTTAIQGVTSCLGSVINCISKAKHRLKFGSEILHRECYFLYFGALYSRPAFKLPVGFYLRERKDDLHEWMKYLKIPVFTHIYQGNVNQMQNTKVEPWKKCQKGSLALWCVNGTGTIWSIAHLKWIQDSFLPTQKQQMWTPTPFVTNLDETVSADKVETA